MRIVNGWERACAVFLFLAATAISSPAQRFSTLVNFDGTNGSDAKPDSLVQGGDGNLSGTTSSGGANNFGTTFKVTTARVQ